MSEDFFLSIRRELEDQDRQKDEKQTAAETEHASSKAKVEEMGKIVQTYARRLAEQGLGVDARASETYAQFKVLYKNGGYTALHVGIDHETGKLEAKGFFTVEGKEYTSDLGGERVTTIESFEKLLQKTVRDAISSGRRNGGVARS